MTTGPQKTDSGKKKEHSLILVLSIVPLMLVLIYGNLLSVILAVVAAVGWVFIAKRSNVV